MEQNLLTELTKRLQQGKLTEQEEDEVLRAIPEIEKQININKNNRRNKKHMAYNEFCADHENKTKISELCKERNEINKVLNRFSKKWTIFSVLYAIVLLGGGITLSILFPLLNINLGITFLSILAFVASGVAIIKPIAKLLTRKTKKYWRRHAEISEEIATLNNEMWEEFNAQYKNEQINDNQDIEEQSYLKLVNLDDNEKTYC